MGDCLSLDENLCYHIAHILVKAVPFLEDFKIPQAIDHPYLEDMKKKSEYHLLDLLDKNENKSDDIVDILDWIHQNFVPHTQNDHPDALERIVFGGDVLTNERAYSGQMAMMNGRTSFERMGSVVHRPEGLHGLINLTLLIYQTFYKPASGNDRGSLYQLRNVVNRRDVRGPDSVTSSFRPHFTFLQDFLDACVLTCALDYFGMENLESVPTRNKPPPLTILGVEQQCQWVFQQARVILQRYIKMEEIHNHMAAMQQSLDARSQAEAQIDSVKDDNGYHSPRCAATYKQRSRYIKHMSEKHGETLVPPETTATPETDSVSTVLSSLLKCILLLHDTEDAYKFGDGDRIFRNAKFEMLLYDVKGHIKYKLWMFCFMAYEKAILTAQESFEYKWNLTVNTKGGPGNNIPNDNLCELYVKKLKDALKATEANITFENARLAVTTLQHLDEIVSNAMEDTLTKKKSGKKTRQYKTTDIDKLIVEFQQTHFYAHVEGRQKRGFDGFTDLFKRVSIFKLSQWLKRQKQEMVIP